MKQTSNPVASVNQEEMNRVKPMKMFGGVITVRQDVWVKMMMAKGGLPVTSIVKSTIFRVLALIMQKINIMILILKTRCFFPKNVNKSIAEVYILSCEVIRF